MSGVWLAGWNRTARKREAHPSLSGVAGRGNHGFSPTGKIIGNNFLLTAFNAVDLHPGKGWHGRATKGFTGPLGVSITETTKLDAVLPPCPASVIPPASRRV